MVRDRRRARAARRADPSLTAQEHAVRDAEAIVCLAWAEELLHQNDRMALALDTARQECQAASDRLVAAQHCGDPRQIGMAHAMLEDALAVRHTGEVASERVRQALEAVLDSLARTRKGLRVAATARHAPGGGLVPATELAASPGLSIRHALLSDGGGLEAVRRALGWVRHLRARRALGPGQP